jgi:hypothetical protein
LLYLDCAMSASIKHTRSNLASASSRPKKRKTTPRHHKAGVWPISAAAKKASKPLFSHLRSSVPNPKQPIMISCFDESGIMAKPWADAGYLCYVVDLQHPRGETRDGNIVRVGMNFLDCLPPKGKIHFVAFFPPCTDVCVSGARWFTEKGLGSLLRTLQLFKRSVDLAEMIGCRYLIENPVSVVSTHWRRPDYTFHPSHYGDPYLKKTCLWVGGGFVMPRKAPVKPNKGMMLYWLPPSSERAALRSKTPAGFAKAVFEANARPKIWRPGLQKKT